MKRLLLFLFTALTLHASGIDWYYDYGEALDAAKKEDKHILVFITQPGCGTCNYMKENVFVDTNVETYINAHYIPLDMTVYDKALPEHLKVRVTPVFHFLDAEGKPLRQKMIGGKTAPSFLKLLKEARNGKEN